jgi:hypothetical protein
LGETSSYGDRSASRVVPVSARHFIAVRFFNTNAYNIFSFTLFRRPYFRRRSNALEGMAVASFIGVTSGIYIWKPVLEEMQQNRVERERQEAVEGVVSNKNEGN